MKEQSVIKMYFPEKWPEPNVIKLFYIFNLQMFVKRYLSGLVRCLWEGHSLSSVQLTHYTRL